MVMVMGMGMAMGMVLVLKFFVLQNEFIKEFVHIINWIILLFLLRFGLDDGCESMMVMLTLIVTA